MGKKAITQKDFVKYLGVLIDSRLSFKTHVASITKKIARTIGLLYKLRYYMNQKTLIMIYNSLIFPHLTLFHMAFGMDVHHMRGGKITPPT